VAKPDDQPLLNEAGIEGCIMAFPFGKEKRLSLRGGWKKPGLLFLGRCSSLFEGQVL
jgi:hypothetical protein